MGSKRQFPLPIETQKDQKQNGQAQKSVGGVVFGPRKD